MKNYTTAYSICRGNEELYFPSEKAACDYLGVARCSVASCYRRGAKCKGYTVLRHGSTTHNATNTRLHKVWEGMHERCERSKHPHYDDYGGRGITVCGLWSGDDGFMRFKEWAEKTGYSDGLTIDRIDNNLGYFPENCRWATYKEQANNKRSNRIVAYRGAQYTVTQLAEAAGLKKTTLKERLNSGWSVEDAVNTPVRLRTRGYRMSKMDGWQDDV